MKKLIEEFKRGWYGISQPSLLLNIGFAVCCVLVATLARWFLSHIRPDVYFTPYFPAVFFATAFGGVRIGIATVAVGAILALSISFGDGPADFARFVLLLIYLIVCGLLIWLIERYRAMISHQREISKRLIEEEKYRKLVVEELQHRLKNKLSTVHAVLHQVLYNQPEVWASIDRRIRSLSTTDDLIARLDGSGCDIKDLLISELGPYGHVRLSLNGGPLFLPAKLAVSLALIFHELATNAGKYGALSSPQGLLQVSWSVSGDRLAVTWDEAEGPAVGPIGQPGFGTKLLKSALRPFDGKTEISYMQTGVHCTMQCRIPQS